MQKFPDKKIIYTDNCLFLIMHRIVTIFKKPMLKFSIFEFKIAKSYPEAGGHTLRSHSFTTVIELLQKKKTLHVFE